MRLDIRYARSAGAAIAYQIVGDGLDDLVYVPDFVSNRVLRLGIAALARFLQTPTNRRCETSLHT